MPTKMLFSILLLGNLGLLNGRHTIAKNLGEYVVHSKSGHVEYVQRTPSIPQKLVFMWTRQTFGYSNPTTLVPSYVASVSYGPHTPSLVYTCILTSLLPSHVQSHSNFIHGADGYSCTISKGKPGPLTEPIDNTQKPAVSSTAAPVTQPTTAGSFQGSAETVLFPNDNQVPNPIAQQPVTIKTLTARYI